MEDTVEQISCRKDFLTFACALVADLRERPDHWENRDLASYLEALEAGVADMKGYYDSQGQPVPEQPSWKTLGQLLLAARVYE